VAGADPRVRPGERLSDRYEIIRELGRGGAGITYLARDAAEDRTVVAKLLHVGLLEDWKAVELFEREASVLKQLHHAQIPAYVDYFRADLEGAPRFVLVREFVDGQSLQDRVEQGWRGTEEEIRAIGVSLLGVVRYIHSLRPPVIHRDINPRNVIVRRTERVGEGRAPETVFLLDFGGVQDAIRISTGGASTIVGTPGYTPMEQFVGRATARSDLYAVGATLLFLLTHRNPADLPVKDMRIDFASCIEISSRGLADVLAGWLDPDEARRALSIEEGIALLEGTGRAHDAGVAAGGTVESGARADALPDQPPEGSRIRVTVENGVARFIVPESGEGWGRRGRATISSFAFVFVMIWFVTKNTLHTDFNILLYALPFLAGVIGLIAKAVSRGFGGLGITISRGGLSYTRQRSRAGTGRTVPLDAVGECRIEGEGGSGGAALWGRDMAWGGPMAWGVRRSRLHEMRHARGQPAYLAIEIEGRTLKFAEGLTQRELEWLRDAINARLAAARAGGSNGAPG
jgi:hypothetical protein